ncbi:hypothetical protein [Phyllobacterium sp. P5_D12]
MATGDDKSKAERKARLAEKMRKWRAANPPSPEQKAKAAERARKWRQENKQHYEAYMKSWREANPERCRVHVRAYEARKRAVAKAPGEE